MAKRKLTYEQHLFLLQDVKSKKYRHMDLYLKYNISKATFGNYLRVTPSLYRNYKDKNLVHSFFDKIDNEAKAYFLGLLFADGYIGKNTHNRFFVSLCAHKKDAYIPILLHKAVNSCTIIQYPKDNTARCTFSSKQMYTALLGYGMAPFKKFGRKIPELLPKKYLHHFIRGLFDGDGCICRQSRGNGLRMEFIASPFLLKLIIQELKLHCSIWKRSNITYIQYGAKKDIENSYKYLYKNATIYLKRKRDKFK